jgi:isoleucyl-tRNA synthetase
VSVKEPMSNMPYDEVAAIPDRVAIEHELLDRWRAANVFEARRARNRGREAFSFLDGPITANNRMGVHHAWGRALKDIVQRYQAMRARDLRYQNGFDCQGLWVEVEVERDLGFNSKSEIERYGLDRFARACRDRVTTYAGVISEQSERLGMWMDWDNSYFTMTDENISMIWTFLAECHRRGWLYQGHRLMPWCHRCGTSLSQHELTDSYRDLTHPSLFVRMPLDHSAEALAVWTTTPWTLPANVAVAVAPDATYVLVETDLGPTWVARDRVAHVPFGRANGQPSVLQTALGQDLAGRTYRTPFADVPAQQGVEHRVVAWDGVSLAEGTGAVHIAPGCGTEDYELGAERGLATLAPLTEDGHYIDTYGWLAGRSVEDIAPDVIAALDSQRVLLAQSELTHRYPVCWRCSTPLVHRVVDEWFLSSDEIREPMRAAARTVDWRPAQSARRMYDWLTNMGDWCISRKRYWGLPLPFYRCAQHHLTVVASRDDLVARARRGTDNLVELHRPWIDDVVIACDECGQDAHRVTEVGDCWLDAGIVAFSTLPVDERDRWFPAAFVCEMHEQIRLWFYSLLFMSVVLDGRAPYASVLTYGRVNDEDGREMHKSWGNAISFDDAVETMGADTMRWLYAAQSPSRDVNFGFRAGEEIARKFLTFWNAYAFFVTFANVEGAEPRHPPTDPAHPLDRWMLARTRRLVVQCTSAYDAFDATAVTDAFDAFADDLSNWYLRLSRRRFWQPEPDAFATLWHALTTAMQCVAPVMPFIADHIWSNLTRGQSVHLEDFPAAAVAADDDALLDAMQEARRVTELGRAARTIAEVRRRQPLKVLHAVSADEDRRKAVATLVDLIADECNVKEVRVAATADDLATIELVPNFARLGPKLRDDLPRVAALVREGRATRNGDGTYQVGEWTLDADDVVSRTRAKPGLAIAEGDGWVVAVDTSLTEALELEGRARDLVREIQQRRKDLDLHVTARIAVAYPHDVADVIDAHGEWIAEQTLATTLEAAATLSVHGL